MPQISLGDTFKERQQIPSNLLCNGQDCEAGRRYVQEKEFRLIFSSLFQDVFPEIFQLLSDLAKEAF